MSSWQRAFGLFAVLATVGLTHLPQTAVAESPSQFTESIEVPSLPENPTASILKLDPSKFVRPNDPRELTVQLLNGYDFDDRAYEPGTAIEFAPAWLFLGESTTLADWQNNYWRRLASRTFTSVAVTSGSGATIEENSTTSSAVIGVSLTSILLNSRDPRWDGKLSNCVKDATSSIDSSPEDDKAQRLLDKQKRDQKIETCKHEFRTRSATSQGHQLSLAASYLSNGSSVTSSDVPSDRLLTWLTYSWGTQRASSTDSWLQGSAALKYVASVDQNPGIHEAHGGIGVTGGISRLDFEFRGAWTPIFEPSSAPQLDAFAVGGLLQIRASNEISVGIDTGTRLGGDVKRSGLKGFLLVSFGGAVQSFTL